MQCEATITSSWDKALQRIRALGGLKQFKSSLFRQAFEEKHYPCEFLILGKGKELHGAMTYWYEIRNQEYAVGPIWHIGDFDTAKGTSGHATQLLQRFIGMHGPEFYLWCWDDNAEKFWRHMGRKFKLHVHKIGATPWGTPVLLFSHDSFQSDSVFLSKQ